MSITSKITFAGSILASAAIIGYIYYKQHDDRDKLHAGIIRDAERQAQRKFENLYILEKQRELTQKLEKQQQEASHS